MTDLKLAFGCTKALPDDVTTAWGARLIWPNDLVHDRQDLSGPNADALKAWLNGGPLKETLRFLARPGHYFNLTPGEDRTVELHRDLTGTIVGNPQSSHGYLYVAAWLHADSPGGCDADEG